jgi:hypothetical protein
MKLIGAADAVPAMLIMVMPDARRIERHGTSMNDVMR